MKTISSVGCGATVALVVGLLLNPACAQFGGGDSKVDDPFAASDDSTPASAGGESSATTDPPSLCHCIGDATGAVDRINRALAVPLKSSGLEFEGEPLENVISFLQEEYGLPIQLDVPALEEVGLSADEPVSINIKKVSLKSALRLMLKRLQLTYIIQDEVMIVTSPEEAESQLVVCVYDVRDLVNARNATKELEQLVGVVTACIATETWAVKGGGEAEIRPLRPGQLVVSQTRPVHDDIADLLAAMRKVSGRPAPVAPAGRMSGGRGMEMMGGGYGGFEGGYGGRGRAPQEVE
jgi:hypothetical protein